MDERVLLQAVEAVLFVSPEPVPLARLEQLFAEDGVDRVGLSTALAALEARFDGHGVELREVAGGFQLRTRPELAPVLARLELPRPVRFSRAALEALSIVAYRQPTTRAEVEEVRGVDCGGVLKSLLEKGLVRILGRKDVPGRPILYGTTKKFLEVFGLSSLTELPTLKDIEEILAKQAEGLLEPDVTGTQEEMHDDSDGIGTAEPREDGPRIDPGAEGRAGDG